MTWSAHPARRERKRTGNDGNGGRKGPHQWEPGRFSPALSCPAPRLSIGANPEFRAIPARRGEQVDPGGRQTTQWGAASPGRPRAGRCTNLCSLESKGENLAMMRKIFGGAMGFSLVGAVLLGGVLAWSGEETVSGENEVGVIDFDLDNELFLSPKLGPDGGAALDVYQADVHNHGDFRLSYNTASGLTIDEVNFDGDNLNNAEAVCNKSNFAGGVRYDPAAIVPNPVPGGFDQPIDPGHATTGRPIRVAISVVAGASNDCQGKDVEWTARIIFNTVNGAPNP